MRVFQRDNKDSCRAIITHCSFYENITETCSSASSSYASTELPCTTLQHLFVRTDLKPLLKRVIWCCQDTKVGTEATAHRWNTAHAAFILSPSSSVSLTGEGFFLCSVKETDETVLLICMLVSLWHNSTKTFQAHCHYIYHSGLTRALCITKYSEICNACLMFSSF